MVGLQVLDVGSVATAEVTAERKTLKHNIIIIILLEVY